MQIVLANGRVFAIHDDGQTLAGLYPGMEIAMVTGSPRVGDPDPRSDADKALVYRDQRRLLYPSIDAQLDMLYWDVVNGTTNWRAVIAAVKASVPKLL